MASRVLAQPVIADGRVFVAGIGGIRIEQREIRDAFAQAFELPCHFEDHAAAR